LLIKAIAELRQAVWVAIPHIISLLGDKNANVRTAGENAFSKFMKQGKFFNCTVELGQHIGDTIPRIIALLGDDSAKVRMASAIALSKFADQGNILNFSE
jgi:HEAT repeat protein